MRLGNNNKIQKSKWIEWCMAILVATVIVNSITFLFYHPAPWIEMDTNATHAIFEPGSIIIYGDEGYGVRTVDSNGYVNPEDRINNDSYILFMGASHTVGKELMPGATFVDILESKYNRRVYNIAMDGHYYPDIVSGFSSALNQFPNAEAIVIEIGSTHFSELDLKDALIQRPYEKNALRVAIDQNRGLRGNIKRGYQKYVPLIRAISKNIKASSKESVNTAKMQDYSINKTHDLDEKLIIHSSYKSLLEDTLSLMREAYSGKIIIAYHPEISLVDDETIVCGESQYDIFFEDCCEQLDIIFINASYEFERNYIDNKTLPYGFCNTAYGKGHLNKVGHRIMAELIEQELE